VNAATLPQRGTMRASAALLAPLVALLLVFIAWLPMTWQQQLVFSIVAVAAALLVNRFSKSQLVTSLLILVSVAVTLRYGWWRVLTLFHYLHSPWSVPDPLDAFFMIVLLAAELYTFLILLLGYLQGLAPLGRQPVPMPRNTAEWPSVDLFIPTYNEPLELVRTTALAAASIDWPADRLRVVILDDGDRDDFRLFAEEAGLGYIARPEHTHAKAGNINYALQTSDAEFVAIFDSDHVPTRSFLQITLGWFLRDPRLGILQTPHHFYSPDPVERNLDHFRVVPNEGELFYGVIQDGNDLWNATFFCGSCAVIRRSALDEIGGIAVETVTEDAHTSLRMQMNGWNTAYLNTIQAAGLATESVSAHVRQRTRWARGMMQVLRTDNPLFAKGLKPAQRLCYVNAMLHFLYAAPRLIFLTAPLLYLVFGKLNMPGYWLAIVVFAAPHLILSILTNSRIQGRKRHSFWNEIYETLLAPYILFPTWLALVNPRLGKFNVTEKGSQQSDRFDANVGWPFLTMFALNLFGLAMAVPRYLYWNADHRGTVLMNVIWTFFNMLILGVTIAVCYERRQRRHAVRIAARIPLWITAGSETLEAHSLDVSSTGLALEAPGIARRVRELTMVFAEDSEETPIPARVISRSGNLLRVAFDDLDLNQQRAITEAVYSSADRWIDWDKDRRGDNILRSFGRVFFASLKGFAILLGLFFRIFARQRKQEPVGARATASAAGIIAACLFLLPFRAAAAHLASPAAQAGAVEQVHYPLAGTEAGSGILLDADRPSDSVRVVLPSTLLIQSGRLAVHYAFPPNSAAQAATVEIDLNGNVIADLTPTPDELAAGAASVSLPLPVDLFVQDNRLSFQLPSARRLACSPKSPSAAPWVRIDPASGIDVNGNRLRVANDLSLLPEPFVQQGMAVGRPLPFIFAGSPDWNLLRAAGIVASWFGAKTQDRAPDFTVGVGSLPQGNAVLLLAGSQTVDGVAADSTPSVAMLPNPADPFGKLLVLSAPGERQLIELAQAFATGQINLSGASASLSGFELPPARQPDDAPAWVQADRVPLSSLAGWQSPHSSPASSAVLYMRLAPDLNFDSENTSYVSVRYNPGAQPLSRASNIAVTFNDLPANSAPMVAAAHGGLQTANIALGTLPFEFRNTLSVRLYPVLRGASPCVGMPGGFGGGIANTSFLDLGNAVHLARLPNLQLFANAGFPFTRYAGLGHTAVLLPDQPAPDAIALFLKTMGYFGAQTGYPALRLTVASMDQAAEYSTKDLLLLGTYTDAAQAGVAVDNLPFKPWLGDTSLSFRARWVLAINRFLHRSAMTPESVDAAALASSGLIEASESPFQSGRSVVAIFSENPAALHSLSAGLLSSMPGDGIHGRVSFFTDGSFHSYNLSGNTYLVGSAPFYRRIELWMSAYPWFPVFLLLAVAWLVGLWLNAWLKYKRLLRLQGMILNQPLPNQPLPNQPLEVQ